MARFTRSLARCTRSLLKQTVNNTKTVEIELGKADLNSLKDIEGLAIEKNNTYLSFAVGFVSDMSGNNNEEVPLTSALLASKYYVDVTPPVLTYFTMNMDLGILTMYFSETMSIHNIVYGDIRLMNKKKAVNAETVKLTSNVLTAGSTSQSHILSLQLAPSDFVEVKGKGIGQGLNSTWLTLGPAAIYDMVGLPAVEIVESGITGGASMRAQDVTFDMTAPGVEKFRIDRLAKELYLFFSEPIVVVTQKGFLLGNGTASVNLGNCSVVLGADSTDATFNLASTFYSGVLNRTVDMWDLMVQLGVEKGPGAGVDIVLSVVQSR